MKSAPSCIVACPECAESGICFSSGEPAPASAAQLGQARPRRGQKPTLIALLLAGLLALAGLAFSQTGPSGGFGGAGAVPVGGGGANNGRATTVTCRGAQHFEEAEVAPQRASRAAWLICNVGTRVVYVRVFNDASIGVSSSNGHTFEPGQCKSDSGLGVAVGPITCTAETGADGGLSVVETWR